MLRNLQPFRHRKPRLPRRKQHWIQIQCVVRITIPRDPNRRPLPLQRQSLELRHQIRQVSNVRWWVLQDVELVFVGIVKGDTDDEMQALKGGEGADGLWRKRGIPSIPFVARAERELLNTGSDRWGILDKVLEIWRRGKAQCGCLPHERAGLVIDLFADGRNAEVHLLERRCLSV